MQFWFCASYFSCFVFFVFCFLNIQSSSSVGLSFEEAKDMNKGKIKHDEELEKLYQPSKWAKMPADQVIKNHIKVTTEESERVKAEIPHLLDIPFGEKNVRQKFDIFGTDLPEEAPIFIFIHGGYWQELDKNISSYMTRPLHKNGIKTIIFDYTLAPEAKIQEMIDEVKTEFETLFNNKYINLTKVKKIGICGHSAGAHLAISLLLKNTSSCSCKDSLTKILSSSMETDLFLISGIYDLTPLIHTTVNDPLFIKNREEAAEISPMFHVKNLLRGLSKEKRDKKLSTIHLYAGENDSPAYKQQAKDFHEKLLQEKGEVIKSSFDLIPIMDHFDIVENLTKEDYFLTKEIINALKT